MSASTAPTHPSPDPGQAGQPDQDALPPGTRFGEFEILRVLGVGGFGIVYLAHDHSLERMVALKEYMPVSLASRGAGATITVRSVAYAETYAMGLRSFVNEARMLARFDHPSLVKVYRFWEDNATAYMVMPYLEGTTLRDVRRAMTQPPGEAWMRGVLDPMLDALEQLHREGVYHRDIAPDNIVLSAQGAPILLDFGAARRVINDRTQSLTAILKPTYAPIEQYAEMAAMRQGPWTDLYALGAVMHYLLFGVPPLPSTARAVQDDAEQIEQRVVPGVSPRFISAVAWMLGVRPRERPPNVASLRAALAGRMPIPARVPHDVTIPAMRPVPPNSTDAANDDDAPDEPTLRAAGRYSAATRAATAHSTTVPTHDARSPAPATLPEVAAAAGGAPMRSTPPGTPPPVYVPGARGTGAVPTAPAPAPAVDMAATPPRPASRRGLMAGAFAVAALMAAGVLWNFGGPLSASRPAALPVAAAASAAASTPAVADAAPKVTQPQSMPPPGASAAALPRLTASAIVPVTAPARTTGPKVAARRPAPLRAAGPSTAREACGDRRFIALAICMDRECERANFRTTAECVRILDVKRRRAER